MRDKSPNLKYEVEIRVVADEPGYGEKTSVAIVKREKNSHLTTDSRKRKIIDEMENITEDALREASDIIHNLSLDVLTDGELAKKISNEE